MRLALATIVGSCIALAGAVAAQEFFWRDERGQPARETPARKSERGFGGWLVITSDSDWATKWSVPDELATPAFNEADALRVGETVTVLIFIASPLPNRAGDVNVRCDLRVTRPNGSVSVDRRDLSCLEGPLLGDPFNIRLGAPTLQFVGEAGDPPGTWQIEVTLRDLHRDAVLNLRSSIELLSSG
jgi:hypothetical protein